jgi:methionine synthase I (cobalamin-dependent)
MKSLLERLAAGEVLIGDGAWGTLLKPGKAPEVLNRARPEVLEEIVRLYLEAGADILGSNCGNGSEIMVEIAREFRAHTGRPVAIQPNAGLPEPRGGETVYPETPEFMAEQGRALVQSGVSIVVGRCGTTPAHVRALRSVVA